MESTFSSFLWPEAVIPSEMTDCQRCELYKQRKRMIWGEGNPQASITVLLDNPGEREDKEGNPFVCGTRRMLQYAAHKVGFKPDDLFVTYILKCRPRRKYNKQEARNNCMKHLFLQLELQKPDYIFCLGDTAVQSFFEEKEASVKCFRGKVHNTKGFSVFVSYHPLAVVRRPNLLPYFLQDWGALYFAYKSSVSSLTKEKE